MPGSIQTSSMARVYEGPMTQLWRGLARTITGVVIVLTLLFAVHEGVPNPFLVTARENLTHAVYAAMVFGLYAGIRWERVATAVVLPAFTLFTLLNYPITGGLWLGWLHLGFPAAAMAYWLGRRRPPERRGV